MMLLEKLTGFLNKILVWLAGVFLTGMILLTCMNIFTRLVWIPIKGTFELMGFFGAIVAAFALGYTQVGKGHIAVDVLVNRFSLKTRTIVGVINNTVCCLFFIIVSWQIAVKAETLWRTGEVTETLRIIYYPFTSLVALGCAVLALVLLLDILKMVFPQKEVEN